MAEFRYNDVHEISRLLSILANGGSALLITEQQIAFCSGLMCLYVPNFGIVLFDMNKYSVVLT